MKIRYKIFAVSIIAIATEGFSCDASKYPPLLGTPDDPTDTSSMTAVVSTDNKLPLQDNLSKSTTVSEANACADAGVDISKPVVIVDAPLLEDVLLVVGVPTQGGVVKTQPLPPLRPLSEIMVVAVTYGKLHFGPKS